MDRSSRAKPTESLPRPLTSLIGREREVADVAALLRRGDVRAVTLTGAGGVGKTRLAVETAARAADAFPDGVWFVDLAPIRDSVLVLPTIAQLVGLRGGGEDSIGARLRSLLSDSRMLFVLDNFEQVLPSAGDIRALLAGCPNLTILITSREPLKIDGEREFPLAPLAVPDTAGHQSVDDLSQIDAIRLFIERAQAALPSFAVTAENAGAVGAICRRVDGLPLAIELAAARVKVLPPAAMVIRLDQRLPVLGGSRRDVPERQQTMRAAIAWSHDLLTGPERTILRRLAVFVGGFSLEAAEAVVRLPEAPGLDTLDGLASLIDKSLIRQEPLGSGEPRYLMLETVREFALEQLAASGEEAAVRDAHAGWCIDLAERWWADSVSVEPAAVEHRQTSFFMDDYDNVRSAFAWLDATGNDEGIAQLTGAMWWFWMQYGHRGDGRRWLERARNPASGTQLPAALRIRVLQGFASIALNSGDNAAAIAAATEFGELARASDDATMDAMSRVMLGYIALNEENFALAESLTRQAAATFAQLSNPRWNATFDVHIGLARYGQGDLEQAATLVEQSLAGHQRFGDTFDEGLARAYLGLIRLDQDRVAEAAALFAGVLPIWRAVNNWEIVAEWLSHAAAVAATIRQMDQAGRLLGASVALLERQGHAFIFPENFWAVRTEGAVRQTIGDKAFEELRRQGCELPLEQAIAEASALLASVADGPERDQTSQAANPFGLTSREIDVLRLLVEGRTDREIAEALFIGIRTVETHVSNLLGKLGARNRSEATALAVRNNLV